MRLIDLDQLKQNLCGDCICVDIMNFPKECRQIGCAKIDKQDILEALRIPIIDAVPVRHGKWLLEWENEDTRMLRCSECRMVFNVGKGRDGNYCPNCGARMDGERKEE